MYKTIKLWQVILFKSDIFYVHVYSIINFKSGNFISCFWKNLMKQYTNFASHFLYFDDL